MMEGGGRGSGSGVRRTSDTGVGGGGVSPLRGPPAAAPADATQLEFHQVR